MPVASHSARLFHLTVQEVQSAGPKRSSLQAAIHWARLTLSGFGSPHDSAGVTPASRWKSEPASRRSKTPSCSLAAPTKLSPLRRAQEPDEVASSASNFDLLGLPLVAAAPDSTVSELPQRRFAPAPPAFKRGGTGRCRRLSTTDAGQPELRDVATIVKAVAAH